MTKFNLMRKFKQSYLIVLIFISLSATLVAEPDNGKFLPTKEGFLVENIYFELSPLKLQFPMVFGATGYEKNYTGQLSSIGWALSGEIGYNWSGWLLGTHIGYFNYAKGAKQSLIQNFQNLTIGFHLSRVLSKNTFKTLPKWLSFTPAIGIGADLYKTTYYKSFYAKYRNELTTINFGKKAAMYLFTSLQADFNLGTNYAIPYLGVEATLMPDRNGLAFFSSLNIGVRMYPFTSLGKSSIQIKTSKEAFSPDADGENDTITMKLKDKRINHDAVDQWKITILDAESNVVKTFSGNGMSPYKMIWDGVKDDGETVLPESKYTAKVDLRFNDKSVLSGETEFTTGSYTRLEKIPSLELIVNSKNYVTPNVDLKTIRAELLLETINLEAKNAKSWIITVRDADDKVVKTWKGDGMPPKTIIWDGKNTDGYDVAPDEIHTVKADILLSNDKYLVTETEVELGVVYKDPAVKMSVLPEEFTPDGDGENDTAEFILETEGIYKTNVKSWTIKIYDPKGIIFKELSGKGLPPKKITWDGLGENGAKMLSAEHYKAKLEIILKNKEKISDKANIDTGVLIERMENNALRILVSSINFDGNAATFNKLTKAQQKENERTISRVAQVIKKFKGYHVTVEGHANNTRGRESDEIKYLLPLSQKRAEKIMNELIKRGVPKEQLSAVGKGGKFPLVPRKNRKEWWKNRRVEFILTK